MGDRGRCRIFRHVGCVTDKGTSYLFRLCNECGFSRLEFCCEMVPKRQPSTQCGRSFSGLVLLRRGHRDNLGILNFSCPLQS